MDKMEQEIIDPRAKIKTCSSASKENPKKLLVPHSHFHFPHKSISRSPHMHLLRAFTAEMRVHSDTCSSIFLSSFRTEKKSVFQHIYFTFYFPLWEKCWWFLPFIVGKKPKILKFWHWIPQTKTIVTVHKLTMYWNAARFLVARRKKSWYKRFSLFQVNLLP